MLAKELHSQPVTVTNLPWHQADLQYPSTLSTDWLEVIDLEQWRHLLNSMKPSKAPSYTLIQNWVQYPHLKIKYIQPKEKYSVFSVYIVFHILSCSSEVLLCLLFLVFLLFPAAKNPPMIYPWIELSPNNCLCLASYWSMELCICQSFCCTCLHSVCLLLAETRLSAQGVGVVEVLCMVWGGESMPSVLPA